MIKFLLFVNLVVFVGCPLPKLFKCPGEIYIGWKETPPYVVYNETADLVTGPVVDILEKGLVKCCRNNVTLVYSAQFFEYITLVENSLNSSLDIVLPIRTAPDKENFLAFPFVSLVESPGSVLYNLRKGSAGTAIKKSIAASLPLVSLLIVWVINVGVAFWIAEILPQKYGEDRTFKEMLKELWEGIWWSFITLATVGYGDILPTRLLSRIICYMWLLCSSVAIAAYTATVTSVLVSECFSAELDITGSEIGVIRGSKEHKLIVQKNGFPQAYTDVSQFIHALNVHKELTGGIIEIFTASYYQENFKNYRIQTVIEDVSAYGAVLRTRTVKLRNCLTQHVLSTQGEIYDNIRKLLPPLRTNFTISTIEESSQSLLSPSTVNLRAVLISLSITMVTLCAIGFLREKLFLKKPLKKDDLEEFVLLQTIKSDFQETLQKNMENLQADILQLQQELERVANNLAVTGSQSQDIFRAKYK